jgi:hypothetical protein
LLLFTLKKTGSGPSQLLRLHRETLATLHGGQSAYVDQTVKFCSDQTQIERLVAQNASAILQQ